MNDAITGLSIAKTLIDNTKIAANNDIYNNLCSPLIESIINFVWVFPPCFAIAVNNNWQDSDWF